MHLQKKQDSNAHGSGWMLVICKRWTLNWHWDWIIYIFNEIIIYVFNKTVIYIFNEINIYIFNELFVYSTKELFSFNELFAYSTKELFSFCQLNILIQQMNWSIFIQPNSHKIYGQRNISLKIEIWSLFCMDLQKKQDSNAHGSGWMLVICKHWTWNWHWDWKYYIFLTKGDDKVWVTASTKLLDLLITQSRDKCKTLHLPFRNTYGQQTWASSNLRWGDPNFKVTWLFDYVVTWLIQILISALPHCLWPPHMAGW